MKVESSIEIMVMKIMNKEFKKKKSEEKEELVSKREQMMVSDMMKHITIRKSIEEQIQEYKDEKKKRKLELSVLVLESSEYKQLKERVMEGRKLEKENESIKEDFSRNSEEEGEWPNDISHKIDSLQDISENYEIGEFEKAIEYGWEGRMFEVYLERVIKRRSYIYEGDPIS